ncbi:MAG: molybdenum cofactor biosynthesis protein MoaE [Alphaproteobacteria bacterium]
MIIRVQKEDFDPDALVAACGAGDPTVGAVVSFTGLVRASDGMDTDDPVTALTLEHYPGMTERALKDIGTQATARFGLKDAVVVHRVGRLSVGARIVLVVAAASHRQAAFQGADFMMDYLKTEAPFWKREERASGSGHWVDARDSDTAARARWAHAPRDPAL